LTALLVPVPVPVRENLTLSNPMTLPDEFDFSVSSTGHYRSVRGAGKAKGMKGPWFVAANSPTGLPPVDASPTPATSESPTRTRFEDHDVKCWPQSVDSATISVVTSPKPVRILGVGNVLMGDDGFGPYVARTLGARYELPECAQVQDVGTPGLDFTPYLDESRVVIVVDTVTGNEPPGTIKTYNRDQLLSTPPPDRMSPHQPGLREAMMAAEFTDSSPDEILVVGVVPASLDTGTGLSPAVQASVDPAIATVVAELERLDLTPRLREPPLDPDIWWEK
jgi:hydrogenase maturation protease